MEAVDIVKVFERTLELPVNTVLVLQKAKKQEAVKAYKTHIWTLWYIIDKKRYSLLTIANSSREVTEVEERGNKEKMEMQLLDQLFKISRNNELLKSLKNGEFTGWGIS